MATSVFDEKAHVPDDSMVADALAASYSLWVALRRHVEQTYPVITGEWKYYGKSSGWTFVLKSKKRTLLYFLPNNSLFKVNFVLSEKAAADAETAALPHEVIDLIRNATPYVEGRSVMLEVGNAKQLEAVQRVLEIKFKY